MSLTDLVPFKNYAIALLIAVYSFGVWHVSANYHETKWQTEKTILVQKALETQQQRQALADQISAKVDSAISNMTITKQTINQKVIHEITKEPVYTNCVTTPAGVQLIEDAIDNDGTSPSK